MKTAELSNVQIIRDCHSTRMHMFLRARGRIYNDEARRFPDGSIVTTSPIVSIEGTKIITENTIYEVYP